jgi:hypothetical protein
MLPHLKLLLLLEPREEPIIKLKELITLKELKPMLKNIKIPKKVLSILEDKLKLKVDSISNLNLDSSLSLELEVLTNCTLMSKKF